MENGIALKGAYLIPMLKSKNALKKEPADQKNRGDDYITEMK